MLPYLCIHHQRFACVHAWTQTVLVASRDSVGWVHTKALGTTDKQRRFFDLGPEWIQAKLQLDE